MNLLGFLRFYTVLFRLKFASSNYTELIDKMQRCLSYDMTNKKPIIESGSMMGCQSKD